MEADMISPVQVLEQVVATACHYGTVEYDDIVEVVSREGDVWTIRTVDEDGWAGPDFRLVYFGSLGGRRLLELSREGVSVLVEAHGPSLFALLYA